MGECILNDKEFWMPFKPRFTIDAGDVQLEEWIEMIKDGQHLEEEHVLSLCEKAREILVDIPNLVHVSSPVSICGDIHGQIEDLLELFKLGGEPPETAYIFMGDYVDRGHYGILVICLLLVYKVRYRESFTLLRGNHESRAISQVYGFYDECSSKYNASVWKNFMQVFDLLPVAAIVDQQILCVHGGLSPKITRLDGINKIIRDQEVENGTPFSDLLWSDPEYLPNDMDWEVSPRGVGWLFGQNPVDKFQEENDITLIVRGHQLVMPGYQYMFADRLITVWSAPNYTYKCGNKGAILEVDHNHNRNIKIFEAVPDSLRFSIPKTALLKEKYFL